jgi:hypothetical protein
MEGRIVYSNNSYAKDGTSLVIVWLLEKKIERKEKEKNFMKEVTNYSTT